MVELGIATRWKKGQTGNPRGINQFSPRPSARELCQAHCRVAVDNLVELAQGAEDELVRLKACVAILDRAFGKPRLEPEHDAISEADSADHPRLSDEELEALDATEWSNGNKQED